MRHIYPDRPSAAVAPMTDGQAARAKAQARTFGAPRVLVRENPAGGDGTLAAGSRPEADAVAGDAMDRYGVPRLRLILSAAALLIICVDPSEPDRNVPFTYTTLSLYTLYSTVVYLAAARRWMLPKGAAHWIDMAWHTLLVSLSSGTNSLFFFFYFFDILVASFRRGAAEGLRVTVASAALFSCVGYAVASATDFELNRFLLRPVYLLVLGYMIAYWGGLENRLKRRLALLEKVTVLSNPRFGVEQTIWSALERLREHYDANECLLVLADGADRGYRFYQARRGDTHRPNTDSCAAEMAAALLTPPYSLAMLVDRRRILSRRGPSVYVRDVVSGATSRMLPEAARVVVSALDAGAVATVPCRYHHEAIGRLYVTGRAGTFDISDLDFLMHAMQATFQVTDNVRLIDSLASDAAENERKRIARSIHDTVIQPYIGLQLGLHAIVKRMTEGDNRVQTDVERLLALIDAEVKRLRHYIGDLKGMPEQHTDVMLAVRQFASRFAEATGIDVEVDGPANLAVNDRLSTALVAMAAEALSNIRRHTTAHHAAVVVSRTARTVELTVENDSGDNEAGPFDPQSLEEHAQALGGSLSVHCSPGTTAVVINIPL
jgi:signal transduction histidine kinase